MMRTLLAASLAAALPALATDVSVEITGAASSKGQVLVALYNEETFLKKPLKTLRIDPVPGTAATGVFRDVPEGTYAVVAFHDENGNSKVDRNFIGIPTEKIGFTNNPTLWGAPHFSDAKFVLGGTAQRFTITLR
jgi:uncharacterized protein (DUF2141 family)